MRSVDTQSSDADAPQTEAVAVPEAPTTKGNGSRQRVWPGRRTIMSGLVGALLLAAGLAVLSLSYDTYRVRTTVMDPALGRGQLTLVNSTPDTVKRGDVVVFASSAWQNEPPGNHYVLRVAAVAGDVVTCCDDQGRVEVNGKAPALDTIFGESPGAARFTITVPAGRVFLLGDRRDIARDSRAHLSDQDGTVPVSAIDGRVVAVVLPLWTARQVHPARPMSANPLDPSVAYLYGGSAALAGALVLIITLIVVLSRALSRLRARSGDRGRW